jgi:hypothetical protein
LSALIDCDIDRVMRRQVSEHATASEIIIACDIHHVMMRSHFGHVVEESISKKVADETPYFCQAVEVLQNHLEFIDETNTEIIAGWQVRYARLTDVGGNDDALVRLRFLLEEYRIVLFSQIVGAREKVSEKRLEREFEPLEMEAGLR